MKAIIVIKLFVAFLSTFMIPAQITENFVERLRRERVELTEYRHDKRTIIHYKWFVQNDRYHYGRKIAYLIDRIGLETYDAKKSFIEITKNAYDAGIANLKLGNRPAPYIEVIAEREKNTLRIFVIDNGSMVNTRVKAADDDYLGGKGLGLSMTRLMVLTKMNGEYIIDIQPDGQETMVGIVMRKGWNFDDIILSSALIPKLPEGTQEFIEKVKWLHHRRKINPFLKKMYIGNKRGTITKRQIKKYTSIRYNYFIRGGKEDIEWQMEPYYIEAA